MRRVLGSSLLVLTLAAPALPAASAAGSVYKVGAAVRDISPIGLGDINTGGFGLGDGSSPVSQLVGPGRRAHFEGEHIAARAIVIDDGTTAVALATVETQGMFAAYENDPEAGLVAIAERVAKDIPALPAANIVISNDHTHSGPDAIGAWGFISHSYLAYIADQTVAAIKAAYAASRTQRAVLYAGASDAPDLIYTQTCTEALNQSRTANYPNNICDPFEESKDSWVRVLRARNTRTHEVIATVMSYGAHATLGGGAGVHGDWPQFASDALTAKFGGVGIAFEGTNGRIQPCRPACSFTDPSTPGYDLPDRKQAYTTMLMSHVVKAMALPSRVNGPVRAAKTMIRHEVENPLLAALLFRGDLAGAPIQRSQQAPWLVGPTVGTLVSAIRVGDLLINGAPGEPYPNIAAGIVEATNVPATRHWTLALADDQLGYLMAPVEGYPAVATQVAVNDNPIFNVSPTIGDHVMCATIRMSRQVGFTFMRAVPDARCAVWDAVDQAEEPLG